MDIITGKSYEELREFYILSFASDEYYTKQINKNVAAQLSSNSDYIWDNLKNYSRCSEHYCFELIKSKSQIYLMWDTFDNYEIEDSNYWKYPRYSILHMTSSDFFKYYNTFPEDLYIFDLTYEWSVILTHEDYRDNKRYCLKI